MVSRKRRAPLRSDKRRPSTISSTAKQNFVEPNPEDSDFQYQPVSAGEAARCVILAVWWRHALAGIMLPGARLGILDHWGEA